MGVLDKLVDAAQKSSPVAPTSGEAAGIKAKKDNVNEYMKAVGDPKPEAPAAPAPQSNADKLHPTSKFGDRPGEKRLDVEHMSFKKGTTSVPKTGMALVHEGEAVVPEEENPMSQKTWADAVKSGKKPKKELAHMVVTPHKNGSHTVMHHHTHPDHHPAEPHGVTNMQDLHDHMEEHMGSPNSGEAEADAGNPESYSAPAAPGAEAPAAGE